jgi:hypothetical protein
MSKDTTRTAEKGRILAPCRKRAYWQLAAFLR